MKKKLVRAVILALVCTTSLTLSACGSSNGSASKSGNAKKVVNIGIVNAPSGFNALDSSDQSQNNMTEVLFKPLVELSNDLKFVPGLADSITTTDNKTFAVKLNKNAKWTDGKPVTADDVLFTLNLITNPKVAATIASKFNMLAGLNDAGKNTNGTDAFDGAKKVDDHTVNLITKQPVDIVVFEDLIGQYLKTVPKHILKDTPLDQMFKAAFFQNPNVTDGAFKLVTYKKDQYVQMAANKDYFRGTPKLSQLNFKIMQGTELTVQLQSGEIDTNDPLVGQLPNDDISKLKSLKNIAVTKGDPSGIQVMEVNVNRISNANVRKAISYAINRKQIVDNLLKGAGEEIVGPYPKSSSFFNKDLDYPTYDPAKAKELLKAANWDSSKVLKLNVPTGNTVREQSANVIAQNLQEVGIKTQIQKYDFVTALNLAKKHDYDLFLAGFTFDPVNPDITAYIASGQILDLSAYSNSQMDSILAQGKVTVDKAKRTEIYNKVQELYVNDSPVIGTYAPSSMTAVNKRLTYGGATAFGMYANLEKWDVSK
ncbi:ABC transporter substrate-binding protein [Clostridium guangxiense]|uniref:ABC transporter substrate-binding protein n=1 Tax=Clostridium guangxiense TaxID=1662055 RepID=UPI001E2D69C1|nr:ABC transporter substrate-binding protein [Clostridium guangxiense]MCD2348299.1 ABC transporter substrate-binding protein [Clostridium guangxiense]